MSPKVDNGQYYLRFNDEMLVDIREPKWAVETLKVLYDIEKYEGLDIPDKQDKEKDLRVVCISDTHNDFKELTGYKRKKLLPEGDILVHTGDITQFGTFKEFQEFDKWMESLDFKYKIVIAGERDLTLDRLYRHTWMTKKLLALPNAWSDEDCRGLHQRMLRQDYKIKSLLCSSTNFIYLENKSIMIEDYKFYGSPYSLENKEVKQAFTVRNDLLDSYENWSRIPTDTEILLTHSPPFLLGDRDKEGQHQGCISLLKRVSEEVQPFFHVFGHVHEGYGIYAFEDNPCETIFINASSMNKRGKIRNRAVIFDLPKRRRQLTTSKSAGFLTF